MITSNTSLFAIFAFALFLLLADSRMVISECPNGTPTCSHGRCLQRTGRDDDGNQVQEQHCFCEPNYYGEACTLLVESDFSNPMIISPNGVRALSLDWFEGPKDPVNEKHTYGGGAH